LDCGRRRACQHLLKAAAPFAKRQIQQHLLVLVKQVKSHKADRHFQRQPKVRLTAPQALLQLSKRQSAAVAPGHNLSIQDELSR
jgi:hypothetical protein